MAGVRHRLLVMCLLAAALPSAGAAASVCAGSGKLPAVVTVVVQIAPVTERRVPAETLLARWEPANGNRFGGRVLGATHQQLEARSQLSLRHVGGRADCVELAKAVVTVRLAQEVRIDRRYPPGGCEQRRIRAHEDRHVAINADAFTQASPALRARMETALAPLGTVRGRPNGVRAEVEAAMQAVVAGFGDELERLTAAQHRALDTPESYRRWLAGCGHW